MVATIRAAVVTAKENEQAQLKAFHQEDAARREKVAAKAAQSKVLIEEVKKQIDHLKVLCNVSLGTCVLLMHFAGCPSRRK